MESTKKDKKNQANDFSGRKKTIISGAAILILLFLLVFGLTYFISTNVNEENGENQSAQDTTQEEQMPATVTEPASKEESLTTENKNETTETTTQKHENVIETTTKKQNNSQQSSVIKGNIAFPSDTGSWQMICLNKNRIVDSDVENKISLKYVAGSSEMMDSRAAEAYEKMYSAAASDGIYLTPCSGYRSYSTQKRLYYEFVNDYINQGYSEKEANELASRRRMPPGSSEHNIGICMDIITASSSANFQNTKAFKWLSENAADYGFILRYPEDKVDVTGVKFEPWHWRFVGTENAHAIKNSGLCLEEYLGLA